VLIEAKDDGGGGDNWTTGAISRAKLQSNHHHQRLSWVMSPHVRAPYEAAVMFHLLVNFYRFLLVIFRFAQ